MPERVLIPFSIEAGNNVEEWLALAREDLKVNPPDSQVGGQGR